MRNLFVSISGKFKKINIVKKNDGFTLIELLVAVTILSFVIAPLATLFIQGARINTMSRLDAKAMNIAQDYMEQVKALKKYPMTEPTDGSGQIITSKLVGASNVGFEPEVKLTRVPDTENKQEETVVKPDSEYGLTIKFKITGNADYNEISKVLTLPLNKVTNPNNSGQWITHAGEIVFKDNGIEVGGIPKAYDFDKTIKIDMDEVYNDAGLRQVILDNDLHLTITNKATKDSGKVVKIEILDSEDNPLNCKINIALGEAKVNKNIRTENIERNSEYIVYDVEIKVVYDYRGAKQNVTLKGQKVFE